MKKTIYTLLFMSVTMLAGSRFSVHQIAVDSHSKSAVSLQATEDPTEPPDAPGDPDGPGGPDGGPDGEGEGGPGPQ